jgi:hypothetical protein
MTSRLKHKLDLEQVNLKSAYLNESFVQVRPFLSCVPLICVGGKELTV